MKEMIVLLKKQNEMFAFRYGGDEFVFVTKGIKQEETIEIANKITRTIDGSCSATVSVGIAFQRENEQIMAWIERADLAAKQSKANGKNQVTVFK